MLAASPLSSFCFLDRNRCSVVLDHRRDPDRHAVLQVRSDGGSAVWPGNPHQRKRHILRDQCHLDAIGRRGVGGRRSHFGRHLLPDDCGNSVRDAALQARQVGTVPVRGGNLSGLVATISKKIRREIYRIKSIDLSF